MFKPSSVQTHEKFGPGSNYNLRVNRLATRENKIRGGSRNGIIVKSDGFVMFDQRKWFSRNPSRRAYTEVYANDTR